MVCAFFFFFKQKTAYEMRISDWSSDVCSSDLPGKHIVGPVSAQRLVHHRANMFTRAIAYGRAAFRLADELVERRVHLIDGHVCNIVHGIAKLAHFIRLQPREDLRGLVILRSEAHTSELQSLMRISYAVFCLKKKMTYIP